MSEQALSQEVQEIWGLFREVARRQEETDKEINKLSGEVDRVTQAIGDLGGKWGKFVEGMVKPGALRLFRGRGIELTHSTLRTDATVDGKKMEIDIILSNGEYVVAISVKSTLGVDDVNEHIEDLGEFRKFFPMYADRKLIGAVAGIVIDEGVDRYAYRKGLFVIAQSGENISFLNDEKFRPKEW